MRPFGIFTLLLSPLLLLAVLLPACGGDSDDGSPTDPGFSDVEDFAGTWTGSLRGSHGGEAFDCALEVRLSAKDPNALFGTWEARCPGRPVQRANASLVSAFGFTQLLALADTNAPEEALILCGWGAEVDLLDDRLTGTWQPVDNCEDPELSGGRIDLAR